jgi:hypothetical protein
MADHLSLGSEFPRKAKAVPAVRPGRLVSYNESGCGEAQPPIPTFADGRHLSRDWRPLRITLEAVNILIHREFLDTRDSLSVAHTFKNCASENHWSYSRCLICLSDFASAIRYLRWCERLYDIPWHARTTMPVKSRLGRVRRSAAAKENRLR